ncbi:hypothetical protein FRZ06_00480 [Anoxybacterium hadale]|uniref:Uncharacterized protein n=1 Tax=Anoxybacterium hadale TaxID=3408580 RepID=A0ACD1A6D2_9FIRM|nr:hypothetical protein FRZ06_00480 [Clostridiales bacterium]
MSGFHNLTPTNGFDFNNLINARQNNYAWSMSDLDGYIYVGTGRNILVNIIRAIQPQTHLPVLINPGPIDNQAEIWRYKKDGSLPWERVYKAPSDAGITGFRFMIQYRPFGGSPCLYAATFGRRAQILKSTNGVNWFILPDNVLQGTSSRSMAVQNGKLYVSTIDEINQNSAPLLYSSEDPEFYPWESLINVDAPGFDPARNPTSPISNMAVFNNRIYVGVSNSEGAQVWRTNGPEPRQNEWTLIVDRGFGDPANVYTLSMGVFRDYLYVGGTKELPLSWAIPRGCDVIRIDTNDEWQLIVGGNPFLPSEADSASGLGSGFNNPFNVYAWQIQEFDDKLLISTFDDSSNMQVILDTLLANRAALYQLIGVEVTTLLIEIYKSVVEILRFIRYPIGFDLYVSEDGVHFNSIFLNGLFNPNNYGGRILFVDSCEKLYLGTANPFQGCEVWKTNNIDDYRFSPCTEAHYRKLQEVREILTKNNEIIGQNMPAILQYVAEEHYHKFI